MSRRAGAADDGPASNLDPTAHVCAECGARLPAGGACRDHFHALLALEWAIPGGPGEAAHFYLVAAYTIQHPSSMLATPAALDGLVDTVRDVLDGRATIADARSRAREGAAVAGRVRRRDGEAVPSLTVASWPIVVTDVLEAGTEGYPERVARWARSVVVAVDAAASLGG